jgi:hypothetical protein
MKFVAAGLVAIALQQPARAQHLSSPLSIVYTGDNLLLVASGTGIVVYQVDEDDQSQASYVETVSTAPYTPFQLYMDVYQDVIAGMTNGDVDLYQRNPWMLVSTKHNEAGLGFAYLSNKEVVSLQTASAELFSANGKLLNTFTKDAQGRPFLGGAAVANGTAMYYAFDDGKLGSLIETFSAASFAQGAPSEREHFVNGYAPHLTQIAIDPKQCEYAVGNDSLAVYTHPGALVWTVSGLAQPGGVTVNPQGSSCTDKKPTYYVYVTETAANDIRIYNAHGVLVNTLQ